MNGRELAVALMHQYGDWPGSGMKSTVAEYFGGKNDKELDRLLRWILRYYQPKRQGPPVLAEILAFQRELPMEIPRVPMIEAPSESPIPAEEASRLLKDLLRKLERKARGKA